MIAVPLPPGQRCTGQMPPYLWSLQAGEDPGRISSSPILPVPLWEPPLRLCPTGILANRRPPRRAQPAGPAATPLICSAQAGVSRGSVCPAALPSAGPQMKTLPGPAARPAPAQAGQPWGAASGPFLPRQPAGREARPGPVPLGKQSHSPTSPHQGGLQNAWSLQSSTHGGQPAGQSRWPASARESPRIQTRALWAPELVLLTRPRNPFQRCSLCSLLSRGDKPHTARITGRPQGCSWRTAGGSTDLQKSWRPPTAETLAQSPAPGCSGAGADGPDSVDGADSVDGPVWTARTASPTQVQAATVPTMLPRPGREPSHQSHPSLCGRPHRPQEQAHLPASTNPNGHIG